MSKLIVKETVTREVEIGFEDVVTLVKALPKEQQAQLRRLLEDREELSSEDEQRLARVFATFGEELRRSMSAEHLMVVKAARQADTDDNARDAEAMWDVQREAYHRLNAERRRKRRDVR